MTSSRMLSNGRTMMGAAPTRMERRPGPNNRAGGPSSSSEDDDEDDYYGNDEERHQERLLSERHGEAPEDDNDNNDNQNNKGKKRGAGQTDQEAAKEYADTSSKPKKHRLTLQPEALVGAQHGLLVLQKTFPSKLQNFMPATTLSKTSKNNQNIKTKSKVDAAALFSRKLVSSYFSYCNDLFPSFAPEDVLLKIESFGSKKQVKDYQQHLREEVRNAHLERIYGLEKAESMIRQLQEGLLQQPEVEENEDDAPAVAMSLANEEEDDEDYSGSRSRAAVPGETRDKENADPSVGSSDRRSSARNAPTPTEGMEEELSLPAASLTNTATAINKRHIDESSDEEEELSFEDEEGENGPPPPKDDGKEQQSLVRPNAESNQTLEDKEEHDTEGDKDRSAPVATKRHIEESSDEEEATFDEQGEDEKEDVNKEEEEGISATTKEKEAPPQSTPSDNSQTIVQELGEDDDNHKPAEQPADDMEAQEDKCSDTGLDTQEPASTGKDAQGEEEIELPCMIEMEADPGTLLQTDQNSEDSTTPQSSDVRDPSDPMAQNDEDKNNDTLPISGDGPEDTRKSDPKSSEGPATAAVDMNCQGSDLVENTDDGNAGCTSKSN